MPFFQAFFIWIYDFNFFSWYFNILPQVENIYLPTLFRRTTILWNSAPLHIFLTNAMAAKVAAQFYTQSGR